MHLKNIIPCEYEIQACGKLKFYIREKNKNNYFPNEQICTWQDEKIAFFLT